MCKPNHIIHSHIIDMHVTHPDMKDGKRASHSYRLYSALCTGSDWEE